MIDSLNSFSDNVHWRQRLGAKAVLCLAITLSLCSPLLNATTFTLNITDDPGQGLYDPTPVAPVGGNSGTTLGEQRQIVYQYATAILATIVDSPATIVVDAGFKPLACSATSGTIGQAGALGWSFTSCGLTTPATYHPYALANALNGLDPACNNSGTPDDNWPNEDLFPAVSDFAMNFNSNVDNNNSCLNNKNFYYGLDGNAGSDIDLLTTMLHEMLHGMGFSTLVNLSSGAKPGNLNDVYMRNLEDHSEGDNWNDFSFTNADRQASAVDDGDLHWTGASLTAALGVLNAGVDQGHVQMYAPSTLSQGSSVSHFDTDLSPNELMEPFITGSSVTIGLAKNVLEDVGWPIFAGNAPVLPVLADQSTNSMQSLSVGVPVADNDTPISSLQLTASSSNTAIVPAAGIALSGSGRLRTLTLTPLPSANGTTNITVQLSDGAQSVLADFELTVVNTDIPVLSVSTPMDGAVLLAAPQLLQATALDNQDGDISAAISWHSSLDGALGSGADILVSLSDGVHQITASVTDSDMYSTQAMLTVTVDLNGDLDGDGLINALEIALGTDPLEQDSDGDGLSDFAELAADGDPSSFAPGVDTDPNDPDTDGDGSPDGNDPDPLDPTVGVVFDVTIAAWSTLLAGCLFTALAAFARRRAVSVR